MKLGSENVWYYQDVERTYRVPAWGDLELAFGGGAEFRTAELLWYYGAVLCREKVIGQIGVDIYDQREERA